MPVTKSTQDLYVRGLDREVALALKTQGLREGVSLARLIERLWRERPKPRPSGG